MRSSTPPAERPALWTAYWRQLTPNAGFPGSYNFDLFTSQTHAYAFHPAGGWRSADGISWQKTDLPNVLGNLTFADYVPFNGGVYALASKVTSKLTARRAGFLARPTSRPGKRWPKRRTCPN